MVWFNIVYSIVCYAFVTPSTRPATTGPKIDWISRMVMAVSSTVSLIHYYYH